MLVPVHPDGHKFIAAAALAALLGFLVWDPLGWVAAGAALYVAYFFRDPDRVVPLRDGLVVAPADGAVSAIEIVEPPAELDLGSGPRTRVSITLSMFDVHINRVPVAGRIHRALHIPGQFLNPTTDKASEDNERRTLVIETPSGTRIGVVQIAGWINRRIVAFVDEGDSVAAGERFGLIRFGSRVDTYLPPGAAALVATGQRTIAGETVLADMKSVEPDREARRV